LPNTNLEEITTFRGGAGEVVRGFVSFSTLLALLPVALLMLLLGAGAGLIMKLVNASIPVAVFLVLLTSSPIVGRFAMAARQGDLTAGFMSEALSKGDTLGFVGRHAVLVLIWGTPLAIVGGWLMRRMAEGGLQSAVSSGTIGIALLVVGVIGQSMSLLVATKADSVREALSVDMYRWVWARRQDWAPFLASLIGGAALFTALVWPLFGLLSLLLIKMSPTAGVFLGAMTYAAPGLAAPVLYGRLCGAFVYCEEPLHQEPERIAVRPAPMPEAPTATVPLKTPAAVHVPATHVAASAPAVVLPRLPAGASGRSPVANAVQAARRVPVDQALAQLRLKAASDPASAVTEAELLRQAYPAHPQVAAEWARILAGSGTNESSLAAIAAAIATTLSAGTGLLALELFAEFTPLRDKITFAPPTLEALGRALLQRNQGEDALWCFAAMARMNGDATRVQKGLIAVAEAMMRNGDSARAKAIFDQILTRYPDSPFATYIEDAKGRL